MNEPAEAADSATTFPAACAVSPTPLSGKSWHQVYCQHLKQSRSPSMSILFCFVVFFSHCLHETGLFTPKKWQYSNLVHKHKLLSCWRKATSAKQCAWACVNIPSDQTMCYWRLCHCGNPRSNRKKNFFDPFSYWWLNCSTGVYCESLFAQMAASSALTNGPKAKGKWCVAFFYSFMHLF